VIRLPRSTPPGQRPEDGERRDSQGGDQQCDPEFAAGQFQGIPDLAQLVRSGIVVDVAEGFMEVAGQGVGGGDDVVPAWISMVR
jgi:hypothetical protein